MIAQPKYSKLENERRWHVDQAPPSITHSKTFSLIEDKYLSCGRLRLRKMTENQTGDVIYKLCKKYGAVSAMSEPITNIYLSAEEYAELIKLEGTTLRKRRYKLKEDAHTYSVDFFEENNEGLITCEIEAESETELMKVPAPSFASKEITGEETFAGATLSRK